MKQFLSRYSWENIFYLLSFFVCSQRVDSIYIQSKYIQVADWLFPLNLVPIVSGDQYVLLYQVCLYTFLALALLPLQFPPLGLVLWATVLSLMNSFDKISNSSHGFFLAALGMTIAYFIDKRDKKIRFSYAVVASTYIYVASGLWKLFALFRGNNFFSDAANNLPGHIAFGLAENYREVGMTFLRYLFDHPKLSAAWWLLIITTQILTPLAIIFLDKWRFLFLLILIAFHAGAQWVVGPVFISQVYLLALLAMVSFKQEWLSSKSS